MPSNYAGFLWLAVLIIIAPGPDFAVVLKNSLIHGRSAGTATGLGVVAGLLVQGLAAAFGVAALVVRSATAFNVLKIVGACYLGYLGFQALRAAFTGRPGTPGPVPAAGASPVESTTESTATSTVEPAGRRDGRVRSRAFRQGALSNITNPKVLAFYFSLLPQFVDGSGAALQQVLLMAGTHAFLSLWWLLAVVALLHQLRSVLRRPRVRRSLEGFTGIALVGLGAKLITTPR